MKVIFFGSSGFSANVLRSLTKAGVEFPLVITKTPKKKGRGRGKQPTPVGILAKELFLNLIEVDDPNKKEIEDAIKETGVKVYLLASYGAILKENILNVVDYPLNIHPSLLPKYRGVAPVSRAIMNGEKKTGITIFIMNEGIDAGDIVFKKEIQIKQDEVCTELKERLFNESIEPTLSILRDIEAGKELKRIAQDEERASYAPRIKKEELRIKWEEESLVIGRKIKGLSKRPGAYCYFRGKRLKLLRAKSREKRTDFGFPGEVIETGDTIVVSCKEGEIHVLELKLQGRKKMDAKSFINGYHIRKGEKLE